jgi:hypothetical protein
MTKSLSFFFSNQPEERSEDDEVKQPGSWIDSQGNVRLVFLGWFFSPSLGR